VRPAQLVGLLATTATASYLCRVNVSVAGALMMKEFGLSQAAMGRVFSAFLLGYAICQVPAGMLADRFGARRVLAAAALSWAVFTAVMASAPAGAALAFLLCARLLLGIGEAPTFPAAAQAVSRYVPAALQGRANGVVIAAIGVGSAIAPPLISFVMLRWGWRAALLISSAPALFVSIVWLLARQMPQETERTITATSGNGRLSSRSFVLLTISYTLQGYVGYIFVFWFYLYLTEVRHFDLLRGAFFSSLPWILSIVSIPLGGVVSDGLVKRWGATAGRRVVPVAGLVGGCVLLAYGARTANAHSAAVCMALATALVLSVEGPFWATMMQMAGSRSGAAGGVMNMGSNLGGLISPALTPVLAASIGWENALFLAAALSAVGGLLWLGIHLEPDRSTEPESESRSALRRSE